MGEPKWTFARLKELQEELLGSPSEPRSRRRERILDAATELFMQHGYRKTSVDEIARRAGVAKGTVYLYFDKKASLLMHAMAREKEVLFERLRPVLDGTLRDEARLHFYVKTLLTCGRDLPLLARLMSGGGEALVVLDEIDPQLMERATELGEQWLMSLVEDAAPYEFDAQQRRERANVLNTLRWFVTMLLDERIRGGRDLDALAETMADVLVYGLVTRPPGQEDMLDREEEEP